MTSPDTSAGSSADSPGTPLRTAILGYGVAGRFFHGAYLRRETDFEVTVVATSNPERVAQARKDHPGVRIIEDPRDVVEYVEELDLVVVCTPPASHVELALAAMRAGLDVVVDKPLAPSSTEGAQLVAEAEALGRRLTVFQNRRFDADFLTLKGLLAEEALGTVHTLESRFETWKPAGARGWKAHTPVSEGGGLLFDLGPHLIDQAVQLLGPVTRMLADVRSTRGGDEANAAPDVTHLVLTHASGATSHLTMSSLSALEGPRFHVSGDRGAWRSFGKDPQEGALRGGTMLPGDPGFGEVPEELLGELGDGESVTRTPSERGDYGLFYRELARALRGEGELPVDPQDSVDVLRLIEIAHTQRSADLR